MQIGAFMRLDRLFTDAPLRFRPQNGGDYTIPALTLQDDLAPGITGFCANCG